jgi:hypothetical protein
MRRVSRSGAAVATAIAAMLVWAGCGSGASNGFADESPGPNNGGSPGGGGDFGGAGDAGAIFAPDAAPPEVKTEGNYQSPVATGKVVWIANPTSGRVAYVDVTSLDVKTIEAGDGPTYLAAVPDPADDVAIVINVTSHDATLLRDHQGALTSKTFPVTADANSWAVSASGRWAIAWTDATHITDPDPTQGFQDIAVIDLTGARPATTLAVGYRPVKVAFSADGARAFAVTQDGISVVDLLGGASPKVTQNFAIDVGGGSSGSPDAGEAGAATDAAGAADAGDDAEAADGADGADATGAPEAGGGTVGAPGAPSAPAAEDVSITPDGAYALVRREGDTHVAVLSLKDGVQATVSLPTAPTDLTLSPAGDFALAVMRDTSTVAVLPIPGIASAPASFTTVPIAGETVGRALVTKSGKTALLFTTAVPVERLTVLTLGASPSFRVVTLHSPVLAVFPSDDGQNAVVVHQVTPDPARKIQGAFSVVPIGGVDLPAKIVPTPAPPTAVALAPSSDRALVSIRDDSSSTFGAYLAEMPSLAVTPYTLASPPIAVGIAEAASRGYVAQDHPEGRITILDLAAGQARTITGFELGARVVDGSQP